MQTLTSFFANLSFTDPVLWIALGAGLAVLLGFVLLGRRPSKSFAALGSGTPTFAQFSMPDSDAGAADEKPADDRRRSVRRAGMPTPVMVLESKKSRKARNGYVLDRSSGGVRLALDRLIPTGMVLQVRPLSAASDTPWVNLIVRSCREVGDYYELGCQFDQELPWNVLLQFG